MSIKRGVLEKTLAVSLIQRLKTTSLRQGGGVLWREQRRRAHGMKVDFIVTKFIINQNK